MAVSCLTTVNTIVDSGHVSDIIEMAPLVPKDIIGLSSSANTLFRFETIKQETVKIRTVLTPTGGDGDMLIYVSMFKVQDQNPVISLGTSIITEQTQIFQKDLAIGLYVICIKTDTNTYNGTIMGEFSGFNIYAKLAPEFFSGESLSRPVLDQDKNKLECPEPILFEIIDGELPEGLEMTIHGKIRGIPPNQDCVDSNKDLSPSVNWYGEYQGTGEWYPWGRMYKFLVRIYMPNFPATEKKQWFCIRVYNDWSIDRDSFMSMMPMETIFEEGSNNILPLSPSLPKSLCPTIETPIAQPRFIDKLPVSCTKCEEEIKKPVIQMIKIPAELLPVIKTGTLEETIKWWEELIRKDTKSLCTDVAKFIETLKNNDAFQVLLRQWGYKTSEEIKAEKLAAYKKIVVEAVSGFIKITQSEQIDGRNKDDMDYKYFQNQLKANKSLPFDFQAFSGEIGTF